MTPKDGIAIAQEVARCGVPREGFDSLLSCPLRSRVLGDVEVEHPPPGSALEAWLKAMRGRASAQRVRQDIRAYLAQRREGRTWRTYRDHRLEWMMRSGGQQIVLDGLADGSVRFTSHTFR